MKKVNDSVGDGGKNSPEDVLLRSISVNPNDPWSSFEPENFNKSPVVKINKKLSIVSDSEVKSSSRIKMDIESNQSENQLESTKMTYSQVKSVSGGGTAESNLGGMSFIGEGVQLRSVPASGLIANWLYSNNFVYFSNNEKLSPHFNLIQSLYKGKSGNPRVVFSNKPINDHNIINIVVSSLPEYGNFIKINIKEEKSSLSIKGNKCLSFIDTSGNNNWQCESTCLELKLESSSESFCGQTNHL